MGLSARGQQVLIGLLLAATLALGVYAYGLQSRLDAIAGQMELQSDRLAELTEAAGTDGPVADQLRGLRESVSALQGDWTAVSIQLGARASTMAAQLDALGAVLGSEAGPEPGLLAQVRDARARLSDLQAQIAAADAIGLRDDVARQTAEVQALSLALGRVEAETKAIRNAASYAMFDPPALYEKAKGSVVTVYVDSTSVGSGFVLGEERRFVVTSWHVLEAAYPQGNITISVQTYDGFRTTARFARTAKEHDLALLELDMALHQSDPLRLADASSLVVGEPVLAIGNPLLFQWSASTGVITRLNRIPQGIFKDAPCKNCPNLVQFDAVIAPGNSGGPLLDTQGNVVGIVSFGASDNEINFAVPSNLIRTLIDSIVKNP